MPIVAHLIPPPVGRDAVDFAVGCRKPVDKTVFRYILISYRNPLGTYYDRTIQRSAQPPGLSCACLLQHRHQARRPERLAAAIDSKFNAKISGFHDAPAGPHPIANLQIIFTTEEFANVVPWLMLNREGLDILVHPLTDDSVDDHSIYAIWLGAPVALKLETLRRSYPRELLPTG